MPVIRLLDLPHHAARERLSAGAIAWILVNPVEYHGPHLPLDADRLQSLGWMVDLHRALGELGEPLLAADLPVGVDPAPGPGSRPVTFARVREAAEQACRSVEELGARRVVFVTFHGSPLHNLALHHVVRSARRRGVAACAPFQEAVRFLVEPLDLALARPTVAHLDDALGSKVLADLPRDFHAGFFETSLVLHWAPDSVSPRHTELPPCPTFPPARPWRAARRLAQLVGATTSAAELDFVAAALGWQALDPFPGYTGHPAEATRGAGAHFARLVVDRALPVLRRALAGEQTPGPAMAWIGPLTGWGRLVVEAKVGAVTRFR